MKGIFLIKDNNKLFEFSDSEDIPEEFDHLIRFELDYPEGPHTKEEHDLINTYNDIFQEFLKREKR